MRRLALMMVAVFSTGAFAADPPKFTTPEPDFPADDLRAPGPYDKEYPLPQNEAKAKEQREKSKAWYRAQVLSTFEKSDKAKAAWAGQAKAALEATADFFEAINIMPRVSHEVALRDDAIVAAMKAGCDDPAVKLFNLMFVQKYDSLVEKLEDLREVEAALLKANAPPFLRLQAAETLAQLTIDASVKKPDLKENARAHYSAAIALIAECSKDREPAAEIAFLRSARMAEYEYQKAGWGRDAAFRELLKACTAANAPEALLLTMEGGFFIGWAWDARGGDYANKVSEGQLEKFDERLRDARKKLEAAYAADPARPQAATSMITVCMGLSADRKEMEVWFKRAMEAWPDNYEACSAKMSYLTPKWKGSVDELLGFGRQCLRARNYHARLFNILIDCHKGLGAPSVYKHAAANEMAWADLREAYELGLQHFPRDRDLLSEFAVMCGSVGQWPAAKIHLDALKANPITRVFPTRKAYDDYVKRVDENIKNPPPK